MSARSMTVDAIAELMWMAREAFLRAASGARWPQRAVAAILSELAAERSPPPEPGPLAAAAEAFGLDAADTTTLAMVAAVEIDARYGALFAALQGVANALRPTVGTLLELTGQRKLSAFMETGRLRRHALIELDGDLPLVYRSVRCPGAVWMRLASGDAPAAAPTIALTDLVLTAQLAATVVDIARWIAPPERGLVVLWGPQGSGRTALASAILHERGWRGLVRSAEHLVDATQCAALERDARWAGLVPVVLSERAAPSAAAQAWLGSTSEPRIWIQTDVPDWLMETTAPTRVFQVPPVDVDRRHVLWSRALGNADAADPIDLATRYGFGPGRIARVLEIARAGGRSANTSTIADACRATSRAGISILAERLGGRRRDELVVTPAVSRDLDLAITWAASHARLYGAWGLASGVARARGVTCLFAGAPGTGKTLAAQVLAGAIDRDLLRVDLSQAVSKWLGETEKNLGRLFDEAHDAGAVLFFDEADALFAHRTTVGDSHDRYANLETGYLLQRLESHDGVVILATNRRQDLDSAFFRRFDVIIDFAAPGPSERELLWRHHLPSAERCASDVEPATLARLFELSGGQIRNAVITSVAVTAMSGAADAVLTMPALVGGATRELVRAGRLINLAEYGAWASAVRAAMSVSLAEVPR